MILTIVVCLERFMSELLPKPMHCVGIIMEVEYFGQNVKL